MTNRWVCEGIIREKSVNLIVSEANVGKTWLALDLAIAFGLGLEWLGHYQCDQGPVYYVGGEGGVEALQRRIIGLLAGREVSPAEFFADEGPCEWTEFHAPGKDSTLPAYPLSSPGFRNDLLLRLSQTEQAGRVRLFIFDPLVTMVRGFDQEPEQVVAAVNFARQIVSITNGAVVLCHHLKKRQAKGSERLRDLVRGESMWMNLMDDVAVLTQSERDPNRVNWWSIKRRDDPCLGESRPEFAVQRYIDPILDPTNDVLPEIRNVTPGAISRVRLQWQEYAPPSDDEALRAVDDDEGVGAASFAPVGEATLDAADDTEGLVLQILRSETNGAEGMTPWSIYNTIIETTGKGKSDRVIRKALEKLARMGLAVGERQGRKTVWRAQ